MAASGPPIRGIRRPQAKLPIFPPSRPVADSGVPCAHPTPPKLGLLGKFALLSALPVIALGLALGLYLRAQIRERAVDNARDAARLIAQLGIQPMLSPLDLRRGLSQSQLVEIDASLRNALSDGEVEGVKIWNPDGWVVYSDNRAQIGKTFPPSDELARGARRRGRSRGLRRRRVRG